jgi:cell division protein ZapA
MERNSVVKVSIFGNDYRVSGKADEAFIQRVADHVDGTMKEIAGGGRQVSPARIAILAAFNIASELHQLRENSPASPAIEDRAAKLLELFDDDSLDSKGESS